MPETLLSAVTTQSIKAGSFYHAATGFRETLSNWNAIYSAPRHEKRIRQHLESRQIECFLPVYRSVHRWRNGCNVTVELPLFPGYLFVRIASFDRVRVLSVPGVLSFIKAGREIAELPDDEIDALRSAVQDQRLEPHVGFAVGDRVRITKGALAGLSGSLIRKSTGLRVVLTVELIDQSFAVKIDADDVEPVEANAIQVCL